MAFTTETKKTSKEVLAPRSTELEFCGFPGALFVTVVVPIVTYFLAFGCSEELGCSLSLPVSNPRSSAMPVTLRQGYEFLRFGSCKKRGE